MAIGLFSAMPVFAAGHVDIKMGHEGIRPCALQAESIQEKIMRLSTEIVKGEKILDAQKMRELEDELYEANKSLEQLNKA